MLRLIPVNSVFHDRLSPLRAVVVLILATSNALAQTTVPAKKPPAPAVRPAPPRRIEANIPTPGIAMMPGPRLKLKEGPAVDGVREHLDHLDGVYLGPNGQMAVRINYGAIGVYDSLGRRLWRVDLNRGGELGSFGALGWRGSEMWISDGRFGQIALMDRSAVTKSLEMPTWIRPPWKDHQKYPVFGQADIRGLFADGSMVVIPYNPHPLMGATEYDSTMLYVMRTSETGLIQNVITHYRSFDFVDRAARFRAYRGESQGAGAPRIAPKEYWPRLRISPDGSHIVIVTVDTTHQGIDTIVVDAKNDRGQSLFTRKIGFPRKEFTQQQIDSTALVRYPRTSPPERERLAKLLPRSVASVREVVLGHDYSVWLELRSTDWAQPIVGIDATGQTIGTTYVPETFQLQAADRGFLWLADYRVPLKDIVRYTLVRP